MNSLFLSFKKWSLLVFLFLTFLAFFYFDLHHYLTFKTIKTYEFTAQQWTETHYFAAVSVYLLVFILLIACAIPCASVLTLLGGFLFGIAGIIYAVIGTTLGGMVLFLAIRTAIGAGIAAHASGWIKKMEQGFKQNAFNYLLMLRLIPILPCWVSNISAGALNVPLKTFVFATLLGIFPATFIYGMVGRGLDKFLAADEMPNLTILLTPSLFFPLVGLAFLSLFPVFYKSIKRRNPKC